MTSIFDEISIHTGSLDASLISIGKKNETVIHFLNTNTKCSKLVYFFVEVFTSPVDGLLVLEDYFQGRVRQLG